jgi:methionyl-tRNA synthetase
MLSPFMPGTSRRIFETLGLPGRDPAPADLEWGRLPAALPMPDSPPLFPRADAASYFDEKEKTMTENPTPDAKPTPPPAETTQAVSPSDGQIGIEEFQRMRLVTAKIVAADRVPKSNKLVRLDVDLGTERRQIVAGIGKIYEPESLVGRSVVIVANLKPAKLMGVESNGMVLAATVGDAGEPSLLEVAASVPPGSRVK